MTAARRHMLPKRERAIPVKVSVDLRRAPPAAGLSPRPAVAHRPAPLLASSVKEKIKTAVPIRALKQSVHDWPEVKRRRLMWWLVGGGMTVAVVGWLATVRLEVANGGQGPNLFQETARLLKSVRWPGLPKPSAAEQEIRQLDQQVFPQFQQ
ncbi:MAG: hypothetical protein AAB619_00020 [Patescibacteria group bacterium]